MTTWRTLLRHRGVHDALELVGEVVPIGRGRGAPQVEVDEHVDAVVEVVDDPRDRLGRTFEVVGIDVRADHVDPDPIQRHAATATA